MFMSLWARLWPYMCERVCVCACRLVCAHACSLLCGYVRACVACKSGRTCALCVVCTMCVCVNVFLCACFLCAAGGRGAGTTVWLKPGERAAAVYRGRNLHGSSWTSQLLRSPWTSLTTLFR